MLLYSLLHLTGYDLPLEQIRQFRQWGSLTPGHPERALTPGVETTTGPLGQGFGNGVGMAIAEAYLAARYNRSGFEMIHHFTYGLVSDGDLMEGVASEAASLAGHLKLGKLIYLYDDNRITLAASTQLAFTEDRAQRFAAYGWHTQSVGDGNDLDAIDRAIRVARQCTDRPSLILVRTHIGYGSPHKQDTFAAHGSPLGAKEVALTKENLGWPVEPPFLVPPEVAQHCHGAVELGRQAEAEWSIGMGEDGPTHQPVEQLASLRAIPDLTLIRPGDANETAVAWRVAVETPDRPVALVLSRQSMPTLDRKRFASADGLRRGAYILAEAAQAMPQLILIATGSEVGLIVAAQRKLQEQHLSVRLVSMPCWELFEAQSCDYRDLVLPPSVRARLAVEAGVTQGWDRYVGDQGDVIGVDRFGASAPGPVVMREYGFTVEQVCARARALLARAPA